MLGSAALHPPYDSAISSGPFSSTRSRGGALPMQSTASLLRHVLNPNSVAVIGASADAGKFGGRVMHFLLKHRYGGRIVPINRAGGEVLGVTAYARIGEAP